MKKILLLVLSAILILATFSDASAQMQLFGRKKPIPNTRGKASVKDLGKEIYTAMQNGNTDRLTVFLPSDLELKNLKKDDRLTPDMKSLLEDTNADKLENNFKEDMAALQNQLALQAINTNNSTIASIVGTRGNPKIPNIVPVTINILNEKQQPLALTFDALRIDKRVYLFRNLQVKKELTAVNMEKANP